MINVAAVDGIGLAIGRTPEMHAKYQSLAEKREKYGDCIPCPFCLGEGGLRDEEIIDEHKGVYVVENAFPYAIDNGQEVKSHELIVPHVHATDVDTMTSRQALRFEEAMSLRRTKYGRTVMMRADNDATKSVHHAHAHGFTYGRRIIWQQYAPWEGINEFYFEGEEHKIPDALARAGMLLSRNLPEKTPDSLV